MCEKSTSDNQPSVHIKVEYLSRGLFIALGDTSRSGRMGVRGKKNKTKKKAMMEMGIRATKPTNQSNPPLSLFSSQKKTEGGGDE